MANKTGLASDQWSRQTSDLIQRGMAEDWVCPSVPQDGRDLPDVELDMLAEAMLCGLGKRLDDVALEHETSR